MTGRVEEANYPGGSAARVAEQHGPLGRFCCARYRLVLLAVEPIQLGQFVGSTLRGGFGHAFKQAVCLWPGGDCRRCRYREPCVYSYVFETPRPSGSERLRGIDQIPRPYVIEPPSDAGARYSPEHIFCYTN